MPKRREPAGAEPSPRLLELARPRRREAAAAASPPVERRKLSPAQQRALVGRLSAGGKPKPARAVVNDLVVDDLVAAAAADGAAPIPELQELQHRADERNRRKEDYIAANQVRGLFGIGTHL